jgi:signal transduction histidine kinase
VYHTAPELAAQFEEGAGALIMTDAALATPGFESIHTALARQPAWSDLPVVLLCRAAPQAPALAPRLTVFTNLTVLDRPTSARTLISTIQAALRGRVRQYETRDQLEALRQAEERLRNADKRKDEFLAMLAHELRNPLAPIRTAAEVLPRLQLEGEKIQTIAAILDRQSAHLSRLVNDLLDVSRITLGRIELQQERVNLASVVSQALESVEPLMRERGHRVSVTGLDTVVYVQGDRERLVQCVANILTNAGKYTDPQGAIEVELVGEPGCAVITVTDNGVGIPPELLPQIFDLFVQSERSLDRAQGGLGIGLSLVRRLVQMHGGTVTAASGGLGRGARFEMTLPRAGGRAAL